jgi:hypothetical protein
MFQNRRVRGEVLEKETILNNEINFFFHFPLLLPSPSLLLLSSYFGGHVVPREHHVGSALIFAPPKKSEVSSLSA